MKKVNKFMAIMPLAASVIAPISAFAATDYTTTEESVDYIENDLTQEYDNTAEETKVDVLVTQASTFSVSIPKRIVLNGKSGEKNDADYTIKVAGNIASDEMIHVIPASSFKMKDENGVKADLDTVVTQSVSRFVHENTKTSQFETQDDIIAIRNNNDDDFGTTQGNVEVKNLTSGKWTGIFNFTISLGKAPLTDIDNEFEDPFGE